MNTWYPFIREHVEDKFIKIIFVRTNDDDAEILITNVNFAFTVLLSIHQISRIQF